MYSVSSFLCVHTAHKPLLFLCYILVFYPNSSYDPIGLSLVEVPRGISTRCNVDPEKGLASASYITAIQLRDSESLHTTIRTRTLAVRVRRICYAHPFHGLWAQESASMACKRKMIRNGHATTIPAGGNLTRSLVSSTTVFTDRIWHREATLRWRRLSSWTWRIREHCRKNASTGIKRPETNLWKSGLIFILGSGMLALRCPFRINNSMQRQGCDALKYSVSSRS